MAQGKPQKPAALNAGSEQNLENLLADWRESALGEPQEKTMPTSVPMPDEPTTEKASSDAVVEEPYVPVYPRDLVTEAEIENEHREFHRKLVEARAPKDVVPYKPPPLPPALVEQTRLEMAEGAKRVAEFEKIKREQKALPRAPEPWEGKNTTVFRPPDFQEYKASFGLPGPTVSKDQLKR